MPRRGVSAARSMVRGQTRSRRPPVPAPPRAGEVRATTSAVSGSPASRHAAMPPSSTAARAWPRTSSIHHRRASHRPAGVVVGHDTMLAADPEDAERGNEGSRVGEGMAAGAGRTRQHRVEVHEDRPRDVRLGVGRAAGGRRGQRPADVGDSQVRVMEVEAQLGGGDQAHGPSIASADNADGRPGLMPSRPARVREPAAVRSRPARVPAGRAPCPAPGPPVPGRARTASHLAGAPRGRCRRPAIERDTMLFFAPARPRPRDAPRPFAAGALAPA